jgi:uncharacterized protein (DUF2336 family)
MYYNSMRRSRRKAHLRSPDLIDWVRERDRLSHSSVRTIARRHRVSPGLASAIAVLCGFAREHS